MWAGFSGETWGSTKDAGDGTRLWEDLRLPREPGADAPSREMMAGFGVGVQAQEAWPCVPIAVGFCVTCAARWCTCARGATGAIATAERGAAKRRGAGASGKRAGAISGHTEADSAMRRARPPIVSARPSRRSA